MDIKKLFLEGAEWEFVGEIIGRTCIMFLIILIVLRLSGRRGVRQLTLFEVAIILGMGSAAGDPMFQEDIPVVYGLIVLFSTIVVYKLITFLTAKFRSVHRLLEGKEMVVVRDGQFDVKHDKDTDFSKMEFFGELRNASVEHLGQVKEALLEIDGTVSVLYYPDDQVKYGLPLFPSRYKKVKPEAHTGPFACMYCGFVRSRTPTDDERCERCKRSDWTIAINTIRHA